MASNIVKSSMRNVLGFYKVNGFITRSYATQVASPYAKKTYALPEDQPVVTKLPNGTVVIGYDNNSPMSRAAIFVRSGSRYENYDNRGVSHVLRLCAGQKTEHFSAFGITRTVQQMGGNIVCESGREFISYELQEFVKQTHTPSRIAIVGIGGVPLEKLIKLGKKMDADPQSNLADTPSTYAGGEIRKETGGPFTHVALVGPGAKIESEEAASFAIAQFILGGPAGIKHGSASTSKIASILASAGGTGNIAAINASYTDGGLFGFLLVNEQPDKAGNVVKAIAKGVRNLKITDVDVKNAKAKAKAAILLGTEFVEGELEDMGLQALFTGKYLTPAQVVDSIDKVTASSVQSVITNSAKGKLSMASLGNLKNVPYIDQL
ncbi:cytochrome b-c1 complex subunit 2, mitochondrial [Armadillidium vulgare]|nr:cytochrome b-c1 complex subunit 2, mitochondrial [Armadillidium vulgare]